jgi:hypothetical protein
MCDHGFSMHAKCTCDYHTWLREGDRLQTPPFHDFYSGLCTTIKLAETSRLNFFHVVDPSRPPILDDDDDDQDEYALSSIDDEWCISDQQQAVEVTTTIRAPLINKGMQRLVLFLTVMKFCNTAPWANVTFVVNEEMISRLIASHLCLITGTDNWKREKASLYPVINAYEDMSNTLNIIWNTSRQQGKTSTLAKFLAVLSLLSPSGGSLMNVYSTALKRAVELIKGAKRYLYWLSAKGNSDVDTFLQKVGIRPPVMLQDNTIEYTIISHYDTENNVAARPKNPDSCRGDAPHAALFDEIGTISLVCMRFRMCT